MIDRKVDLLQADGLPLTPDDAATLFAAYILPHDLQAANGHYRIRMREIAPTKGEPSANGIAIEISGTDAVKWRTVAQLPLPLIRGIEPR